MNVMAPDILFGTSLGRYINDISKMCHTAKRSEMQQKHCAMFLGTDIYGYNRHDNIGNTKGTIHAEVDAIENFIFYHQKKGYTNDHIRRKLKKHTMVIMRMNNDTEMFKINPCRNSMPCSDCIRILQFYGVKTVAITTDNGNVEFTKSKNLGEGILSSGRRNMFVVNRNQKLYK